MTENNSQPNNPIGGLVLFVAAVAFIFVVVWNAVG